MQNRPNSRVFAPIAYDSRELHVCKAPSFPSSPVDEDYIDELDARIDQDLSADGRDFIDIENFLPAASDLDFLREFIISTASYIETLEDAVSDYSDEFWLARDRAYSIVTGMLLDMYTITSRSDDPDSDELPGHRSYYNCEI